VNDVKVMKVSAKQAKEFAKKIIKHHVGSLPKSISPIGGGLTNFVFAAKHADGDFIVRLNPQPTKLKEFLKEQWAMARAREAGVPVPEVLEVGVEAVPIPYMISRKVNGTEATHHPDRFRILEEMGHLDALLHTIPTIGFGHTFDWSNNQLSKNDTWGEYLNSELNVDGRVKVLESNKMLSPAQIRGLKKIIADMKTWKVQPKLNHGDLRLKNTMADEKGNITGIIDWEFCTSNVAPYWDTSLALHDLSVDAKQAFLAGYGLSPAKIADMAPNLKAFNLLNYAPFVEDAAKEKDAQMLDRFRTRFSGALDLYSL
jgi:aminoglycoside phosphotransferase (APT) family kinase protein